MLKKLRLGSLATVVALGITARVPVANASTIFSTASGCVSPCVNADQFGILTGPNAVFQSSNDVLNGIIGIDTGGTFSPTSGTISGPVDFADPVSQTSDGYMVPNGSSINNTTITGGTAYAPVLIADATAEWQGISNYWAGQSGTALPANFGTGTNSLTVSGGGPHVYTVGYNVNTNQAVTITGGANDLVVINVPAAYQFDIGAAFNLSGGLTPDQVLINVLGTSNNVLKITANGSPIYADFIVANGNYSVNSATVDGRVFGGTGAVQWNSQGSLDAPSSPSSVPEPAQWMLMPAGLFALAGLRRRLCRI